MAFKAIKSAMREATKAVQELQKKPVPAPAAKPINANIKIDDIRKLPEGPPQGGIVLGSGQGIQVGKPGSFKPPEQILVAGVGNPFPNTPAPAPAPTSRIEQLQQPAPAAPASATPASAPLATPIATPAAAVKRAVRRRRF